MSMRSGPPAGESEPLLVVAHPDDETLWLEPWLSAGSQVLVALATHPTDQALTAARARVKDRFPVGRMEFLPVTGLAVLGRSDWRRRAPTTHGVQLDDDCPSQLRQRYAENHERLVELLSPRVAEHPVVYTHNPWGEYGHEEHIQVCRAVLDAGARHGTCVWAWDGLSMHELSRTSMRLRRDYYGQRVLGLPRTSRVLDGARYRELRDLYQQLDAWTWEDTYVPPDTLDYVELMHEGVELLKAEAPRTIRREASILAEHAQHAPRVLQRVLARGRLRST